MKTDRELLELAAKAGGIDIQPWHDKYGFLLSDFDFEPWNPLEDNGDALRLAVKCEITWVFDNGQCRVYGTKILESFGVDKNAATRRAIVRAAAEIGAALK